MASRRGDIRLKQRHDLGPRRCSGRVQDQRDVVLGWLVGISGSATWRIRFQRKLPGRRARCDLRAQHRQAFGMGRRQRRAVIALGQHNRLGAKVLQIELILILTVSRVQRCRRGCLRNRDKRRRHLRAIGQHNRHPVAAPHTHAVQLCGHIRCKAPQPTVSEPIAVRRTDGQSLGRMICQQRLECCHRSRPSFAPPLFCGSNPVFR